MHGLAREVDAATGLLLHTSLDLPDFVPRALGLIDWPPALLRVLLWSLSGAVAWLALSAWRARRALPGAEDLAEVSGVFAPLLLRPVVTTLALLALAVRPSYPYGFTLPVALTQDWSLGQDLAVLAAVLAGVLTLRRRELAERSSPPAMGASWAPRAWELGLVAFLVYALLTPERARSFEGHPGNEPKYLRMALALGHFGSLDVERVDAPMEELAVVPAASLADAALGRLWAESSALLGALARGPSAWSVEGIRARPVAHLTVRGPDGGAYHVLAPGPSLLLAPALRIDRALNRELGRPGRVTVALLLWNALAAALVAALYALMRACGVAWGLAAVVAGFVALTPPLLFYFHQFYPEVPAALLLVLALRGLLFGRSWRLAALLRLGLLLMPLPFLHQKYLPVWGALVLMALLVAVDRLVTLRALLVLLLPQAVSLLALLLYNQALSGSPRPDALFRALGRSGVGADSLGQGLLGLALDARYGLVPYAPWLLLAGGGLFVASAPARRLRLALPAAGVYYLTVAAAENWTGSISNLGRFVLPVVPLLAAFAALGLGRARSRPGLLALGLTLGAWTAAVALLLWNDPRAANDCAALLARAEFADGNSYVPNLLLRSWADAAPGLWARLLAWGLLAAGTAGYLARVERPRAAASPARTLAGLCALLLALAFGLEHWPTARQAGRFDSVRLDASTLVMVEGHASIDGEVLALGSGAAGLLVRAPAPVPFLELTGVGLELVEVPGVRPGPASGALRLPVAPLASLQGRRGNREWLGLARLRTSAPVRLRARLPG